jgi:hypothetical protein
LTSQYFAFPASVFSYIFVIAKIFVIFVTFRKLFSRKAKINFREIFAQNTKTKIFVSTLVMSSIKIFVIDFKKYASPCDEMSPKKLKKIASMDHFFRPNTVFLE